MCFSYSISIDSPATCTHYPKFCHPLFFLESTMPCIYIPNNTQGEVKVGLPLWVCKTQFILVLLFITILFFMWTTVNPLLPHAVHWQTITFHRAVTPSKRPQHWPWPWPPALHLMVSRNEKADRFWLYHVSGTHPYTHKISKKQAFADHFL